MPCALRNFAPILLLAATVSAGLATGCRDRDRYYDAEHQDYHPVSGETVPYQQWERETHRDHVDLNKRSDDDKKTYWNWRHSHDNPR